MIPFEIKEISFTDIGPIWANRLWPGREDIEPASAMMFSGGFDFEMGNFNLPAIFIGLFEDGHLVGVNSGHACVDNSFRSRGLWVDPIARGKGYGIDLLRHTITDGRLLGCSFCWSLPRQSSWKTYEAVGFERTSDWFSTDTSEANAYCKLVY